MVPFFTVMHLGVGYFWPPCLPAYTCACSPWHSPTLCKSPDPVRQCFAAAMTRLRCQTERRRGQKVKIFGSDSHAPKRLRRVNMQRRRLSSRKSLLWPSSEFRSLSPPDFVSPCVSGRLANRLLFLSTAWMNPREKLSQNTPPPVRHMGRFPGPDRRRPVLFCAPFLSTEVAIGFLFWKTLSSEQKLFCLPSLQGTDFSPIFRRADKSSW